MNIVRMGDTIPERTFEITHENITQLSKFYAHIINEFLGLSRDDFEHMCFGSSSLYIECGETLIEMAQSFYDGSLINEDGELNKSHKHHDLYVQQLKVVEAINRFEIKLSELYHP